MLLQEIGAVVEHLDDLPWLDGTLRALGARHVSYGATDEMYPLVASALIDTLRDASVPSWDEPTELAWTSALASIAERTLAGAHEQAAAE